MQLEPAIKQVETDYLDLADEFDETQASAENTENVLQKNNIRLWGLKKKVEGILFSICKICLLDVSGWIVT